MIHDLRPYSAYKDSGLRWLGKIPEHWKVQRELASQAALSTVSYDDWISAKYRMSIEEMKTKRYWRGYLALIQRMRDSTSEDEVRAEYDAKKESHWGQYLLVSEISAEFATDSAFQRPGVRTQREAQKAIQDVPRQLAQGIPFDQVFRQINAARDPSFRAQKRRIRPNTDDLELWQRASQMKDGDLSSPFETLNHVHLIRRDSLHPAPAFDDVRVVVLEAIARRKAREWVEERVTDGSMAQIRWPLPQRGGT